MAEDGGAVETTELDFDADGQRCRVRHGAAGGSDEDIDIATVDLDAAIDMLEALNALVLHGGRRIADAIEIHDAHPWWFLQDYAYWIYLVPLTQYRRVLERLPVDRDLVVRNAPRNARAVLRLWGRAHRRVVRLDGARPRLRSAITELWSTFGKLTITAVALFSAMLRRPRYLVYTIDVVSPGVDHDFRISSIYRELRRRRAAFIEYVHSTGPTGHWKRFRFRRRPVVYWEELARVTTWLLRRSESHQASHGLVSDDALTRQLATELLARAADRAAATALLRTWFRLHRPRAALVLDDSRHANEIVAASRSLSIPVVGYQHGGMAFHYHPGLIGYGGPRRKGHAYDRYAVWSAHYQRELIAVSTLYDERNTFVSGPIRQPDPTLPRRRPRDDSVTPVRVLVIEEVWAIRARRELDEYLERMLQDPNLAVTVRIRPGWQPPRGSLWARYPERLTFHQHGDIFTALATADVCVGSYSSALSEAILAFVPAVIPRTSFTYAEHLVRASLVDVINHADHTGDVIRRAAATPMTVRQARRDRLWGETLDDGAVRILDMAESLYSS